MTDGRQRTEDGRQTAYRLMVFEPRMARKTRIFVGLVGFVVAKGLFNRRGRRGTLRTKDRGQRGRDNETADER
jgi:hypothetical protein